MMTDRALLYVKMSRARDSFILLTDDREQLAHRLEQDTGVSHSALEATGQSLDVRPFHQLADKELLRPLLQEWRALEGIAEQQGVTPFQLPEAKPLLARLYRRVTCEGIHAPPAITHIVTAHQTYQATRHRKEVDAFEQAWASLQTQASTNGQSIAKQPGVGALLTRSGEMTSTSLPTPVITGVQACRDRLQILSDRLEQCGMVVNHDNQQRIKAKDRINFDWIAQGIKARTRKRDIAFLPAIPELVACTQAFIARYPDDLDTVLLKGTADCATLQRQWTRLQQVAQALNDATHINPLSGTAIDPLTEQTMQEVDNLLANARLSKQAQREGFFESLTANLETLTQQRDVKFRLRDLRRHWITPEIEAAQQGCHPWHVTGYQRIVEHLLAFKRERPAIKAAAKWTPETPRNPSQASAALSFSSSTSTCESLRTRTYRCAPVSSVPCPDHAPPCGCDSDYRRQQNRVSDGKRYPS